MEGSHPPEDAQRRRRYRSATVRMVGISYLLDVILLAMFWRLGTTSAGVVASYATAAVVLTAIFYTAIRSGYSERYADPYLSVPQAVAGSAVQLAGIVLAPTLTFFFFNILFVVFAFVTLRIGIVMAAIGWLMLCAASALAFWSVGDRLAMPTASGELAVVWLSYALTLGRCNLIAWYGTGLRNGLKERNRQLAESMTRVARLARNDKLTGVLNRGSLLDLLDHEIETLDDGQLCVALIDLDHFKSVNDQYGHIVGDRVLERFARHAERWVREGDLIGRYGGEEFLIVFRNSDCAAAQSGIERICTATAALDWSDLVPGLVVTLSAGYAAYRPGESATDLLRRADSAMYAAKRQGRNCALRFDEERDGAAAVAG